MADETELKLELPPKGAEALLASGLLPIDPEIRDQRSIYFDTPDHDLAKAGFSLRIRRSGGKRIQTVKAGGASAGLYVRPEWECPVRDDTPVLDETTPVQVMLGEKADGIAPLFEVRVERRIWVVNAAEATIELALDRGAAVAGERTAPFCEIELELKEGAPDALFALAHRIDALIPVRLGVQTKAERGYRLLRPAAAMFKAETVILTGDMTAAEAFQVIARNCLRQFRLNETLLLAGRNVEALHQARVALRRLRSALSIFRPVVGEASKGGPGEVLRRLAAELGEARNLDVLLDRAEPGALRDGIAAARESAYDRIMESLSSPRMRTQMLDLAQWTASGPWLYARETQAARQLPTLAFAAAALDRSRRKVKKGGRNLAHADDTTRHELRKDAKKLRYGVEFFAGLFTRKRERRRFERFLAALENLQDQLGALNDLATAPSLLKQLGLADEPGAKALLAGGRRKKLIAAAADAHDDLIDTKRFWR